LGSFDSIDLDWQGTTVGHLYRTAFSGSGRLARPSSPETEAYDTYCAYVRMCVCVFAFKINHFVRSRDVFSICDLQVASTMKCDEIDMGCEAFLAKHPDFAELQKSYKGGWPCELEDEAAASQHGC